MNMYMYMDGEMEFDIADSYPAGYALLDRSVSHFECKTTAYTLSIYESPASHGSYFAFIAIPGLGIKEIYIETFSQLLHFIMQYAKPKTLTDQRHG